MYKFRIVFVKSLSIPRADRRPGRRRWCGAEEDLALILEGIELARRLAETPPLRELLGGEVRPRPEDPERRLYGIDQLFVADASIMPTVPRANTNLTTAAIAKRVAAVSSEVSGNGC